MDLMKNPGIYCFKDKDEIVYIGYTTRPIEVRIAEHYMADIAAIEEKLRQGYLYDRSLAFHRALKQPENEFTVEVLYTAERQDTKLNLEVWEMFFIDKFKPRYNTSGVICNYYFSEGDNELEWDAIDQYQKGNVSWEAAKKRARENKKLKAGF